MNGHPHFKPKGVRKPQTGLFPMHEAASNRRLDKWTHSHYVYVWDSFEPDVCTHTHIYGNRKHTHELTTQGDGIDHAEQYSEAFGWKAKG